MNIFVKCITLFVLVGLLACSGNAKISREDGVNALLPPDTSVDIPREYSKDVLRADGQFSFNTLLTTDLSLDLSLYDGSSMPSRQLTRELVAASVQVGAEINATVILKNAASKKILFAGRTDVNGHLEACLQLPAHIKNVTLSIIKNQYNDRTIVIEDITKFSKIDRGVGLLKSQDSVLNNTLQDSDGDLIPDFYDAFPADPARAFRYFVPADEYLSVAFEDNFPNLGDGDYNDFLARYRIERISNSANSIVEINGDVTAVAKLAGYDHRFGIYINFPGSQGTLQVTNKNHLGFNISTQTSSVADEANVVLFERTGNAFTDGKGHGAYFRILFNQPASADIVDAAPFDPYLYVHNTGFDVHLLGKSSLPGTHNPPGSDGFRDLNGFPRGLLVPTNWYYPKEAKFIEVAYPKFSDWRQSMGQNKSDWFLFPVEGQTVTAPNEFADRPTVVLPANMNPALLQITPEGLNLPDKLGGSYVPVGKVYNVTMTNGQNNFGTDFARVEFSYDKAALQSAGLLQEFQVFFLDSADSKWKPVSKVIVDEATQKVTAYTSHFTPFVLTAAPTGGGNVPAAPSCIAADFPSGIGGSGTTKFSLIDENFKYYQDRDYFIQTISAPSPENAVTFADLGFEGALGISTCNGQPPGSCGPQTNHKTFTGTDYINFTAHTNIDVYVMYDTRGGTGRNDVSLDATWLTAKGFTVDIKGDGGTAPDYFVETTDAVRYYAVYKKSYAQGQVVSLDGNRLGAGDPAINTNYWVIVKPAGNTAPNSAASMCVATPDTNPPAKVTNLQAIPGATKVTLRWQNPVDPDFAGVVIRRSTTAPPADINEGIEPLPNMVFSPESFRDDSVLTATTYFYTVFALDANNNRQLGESVMIVTGTDTDSDGLTDAYENAFIYPTSLKTNPAISDTDGDGISDGIEVANATDPTNGDGVKPAVSVFNAISPIVTANANVTFNLSAIDNVAVTQYMITLSGTPPLGNNSNWGALPGNFILPASMGSHTLYAWAKDAAGNVSNVFTGITFTLVAVPVSPVIGTGVVFSDVRNHGMTLTWGVSSDDATPVASLQYKVVKDDVSPANISTVVLADAKVGADLIQDWTTNLTTKVVTGLPLTNTPYNFTILVRDLDGNKTLYTPATQATTMTTWEMGVSMSTARASHTATRLNDGRVLVTGGEGASVLSSAEIFDPAGNAGAGRFTATAAMGRPRQLHVATFLASGRVLITGGTNHSNYLSSAEIFDPLGNAGAGSFRDTGLMSRLRFGHTATLLADGRVLVAGGANGLGSLSNAEIFNPLGNAGVGTFTATASMSTVRTNHTATLLPNGRVLLTGGDQNGLGVSSAEIFDPLGNAGTGSFTAIASMSMARSRHTATLLPNGRVLVAGGSQSLSNVDIFDPAGNAGAGSFTATAPILTARWYQAATRLPNGRVLVTGGWDGLALSSAEIFDPLGNAGVGNFTAIASMSMQRLYHTATLLADGRVLVAGGSSAFGPIPISSTELFE